MGVLPYRVQQRIAVQLTTRRQVARFTQSVLALKRHLAYAPDGTYALWSAWRGRLLLPRAQLLRALLNPRIAWRRFAPNPDLLRPNIRSTIIEDDD